MHKGIGVTVKPIGYWFSHLHQLLESSLDTVVNSEKLTRRHWQVLNTIAGGAHTQAEVDEVLSPFRIQDGASLKPLADDLVARGWVSHGDEFELTEMGRSAHRRLEELIKAHRRRITEGISDEEYAATVHVLERMAGNLESLGGNIQLAARVQYGRS
jgi:DNA-binding MarR family transcriptional regulator